LTEDEGHARIVPASTPRWLHLLAGYIYMSRLGACRGSNSLQFNSIASICQFNSIRGIRRAEYG
jgi:hypothetical protein